LKCGAGKDWRKSVGLIMCKTKKYCSESRRTGISYIQYNKRRLTGLVTSCVEKPSTTHYWRIEVMGSRWRRCKQLLDDF